MEEAAAALAPGPGRLLLANYFGDQRFGSARHGRGFAAEALVAGDFDGALRLLLGTPARKDAGRQRAFTRLCAAHWGAWDVLARDLPRCPERAPFEALARGATYAEAFQAVPRFLQGMCIEALQSLLWNDTLRRMVESIGPPARAAPDAFGALLFPAPGRVPEAWHGLAIPLLSPATVLDGAWAPHARAALEARGLALERLRVPGLARPFFGAAERAALIEARDVELGPAMQDELGGRGALRRMVRFSLPRGGYATVALRALGQ
jgi:tRNA pseudouridine13 synthase